MVLLMLIGALIIAFIMEARFFAQVVPDNRLLHARRNFTVGAINVAVIGLLSVPQLSLASDRQVGFLTVAAFVLALDVINYFVHRSLHASPFLWRLHRSHHSDPYLDASSTFRFHFLESVYRFLIFAAATWLLAIPVASIVVYQAWLIFALVFSHTNIRLPDFTEQTIGWLLVLPTQHRVHHSTDRTLHDSNYGIGFMIWDRLLGTYSRVQPTPIGLESYTSDQDQTELAILFDPLRKL